MGSNKFEEQARDQLRKRQLETSAGSWEKLNAKLNAEENKSFRRPWQYIAAAIAVLLLAGTFMWNLGNPVAQQVVEEPVKENMEKSKIQQESSETKVQIASEENDNEEKVSEKIKKEDKTAQNKVVSVKEEPRAEVPIPEEDNMNLGETIVLESISLSPPIFHPEVLKVQLEKVIAKSDKKGGVSDAEIDALLAEAAAAINEERNLDTYSQDAGVSADALLTEVEDEIYQSFRNKIFEVLKEGYIKARTAVANGNN